MMKDTRINKGFIEPTLKDCVAGDLALVMPHRIITNILEGLEKLDKILQKLDEIKDAIKNHKVEVDVTGKVTCECNCGQNHEGILGDLNDILS